MPLGMRLAVSPAPLAASPKGCPSGVAFLFVSIELSKIGFYRQSFGHVQLEFSIKGSHGCK
jgi:hypothetical protein